MTGRQLLGKGCFRLGALPWNRTVQLQPDSAARWVRWAVRQFGVSVETGVRQKRLFKRPSARLNATALT